MAKRDSYENDDDFLDEEIADWDDEGEVESDADDDREVADDDDDDDDLDDEEEEEADEEVASPSALDDADDEPKAIAEEEPAAEELPVEVEEEIVYPPDDEKAVAALRKLRVRLDVTDKGNVWRVIFDDTNGRDPSLVLLKGLPALRELWLLGTKVTQGTAETFKTEHPKIKVFF